MLPDIDGGVDKDKERMETVNQYDDLVKLLRQSRDVFGNCKAGREFGEAADAITQLQARVADLEKDAEQKRNEVLEEAATHFDKVHRELWTPEVADEIRTMKRNA